MNRHPRILWSSVNNMWFTLSYIYGVWMSPWNKRMGQDRWAVGSDNWAVAHQSLGMNTYLRTRLLKGNAFKETLNSWICLSISIHAETPIPGNVTQPREKNQWMGEYCHLQNNKKEERQNHRKIQIRVVDFNALSLDGRTSNRLKLYE